MWTHRVKLVVIAYKYIEEIMMKSPVLTSNQSRSGLFTMQLLVFNVKGLKDGKIAFPCRRGGRRIRTFEVLRQQSYSLSHLATLVSPHCYCFR